MTYTKQEDGYICYQRTRIEQKPSPCHDWKFVAHLLMATCCLAAFLYITAMKPVPNHHHHHSYHRGGASSASSAYVADVQSFFSRQGENMHQRIKSKLKNLPIDKYLKMDKRLEKDILPEGLDEEKKQAIAEEVENVKRQIMEVPEAAAAETEAKMAEPIEKEE